MSGELLKAAVTATKLPGGAVLLEKGAKPRPPARSLVLAPNLPSLNPRTYRGALDSEGDIVLDCGVAGCGWHAWCPRTDARAVMSEHRRRFHSQDQEAFVVRLNDPRRRL